MSITKAVIPLAGLASRFLPISKSIPKEILPIGSYPIIHWVVKELCDAGIRQILFITNNRSQVFEKYFSPDPWLENELHKQSKGHFLESVNELIEKCSFLYAHQTKPAGLHDAILTAEQFANGEPFFCHMGDSFFCTGKIVQKMVDTYTRNGASFTVATREMAKELVMKKAHIVPEEKLSDDVYKVQAFIEKPNETELRGNLSVIGRFILSARIFEIIRAKIESKEMNHERDFSKLMNALLEYGPGFAVKTPNDLPFYDAGDLEEYKSAFLQFLKNEDPNFAIEFKNLTS